jgi:hypothetical protein
MAARAAVSLGEKGRRYFASAGCFMWLVFEHLNRRNRYECLFKLVPFPSASQSLGCPDASSARSDKARYVINNAVRYSGEGNAMAQCTV